MKIKSFFFSFVALFVSSFSLVSAQGLADGLENFISEGEPILRLIFGDVSGVGNFSSSEVLFAKILVFILITAIVNITLRNTPLNFGDDKRITVFISVIVALLSVRYIAEAQLVSLIWLPYGVLGILLTSILPLIIAFFFFQSFNSSFIRKTGWAMFVFIFLALAYLRWDELTLDANGFNLGWIYIGVAVTAAIIYFNDRNIRTMFTMSEINTIVDNGKRRQAIEVQRDITDLQTKLTQNLTNDQRVTIERALKERVKAMKSLLKS